MFTALPVEGTGWKIAWAAICYGCFGSIGTTFSFMPQITQFCNMTRNLRERETIATNAVFGHRAGIRFNSVVRYIGYVEPVAVYVDYDIIQNGPKALNRSGVCDVLCDNNSTFDWKYAADHGKCEEK